MRITTRDINPGQFYQIGISVIFSVVLAVVIRHGYHVLVVQTGFMPNESVLAALAFLIGLFPSFFLDWLRRRFEDRWFKGTGRADELSLEQVEGLSSFAIFRLRELDIHNAQNLAHFNPVTLYLRTRYGLNETIDWISQALLLTVFKFNKTKILRDNGIRTILDFYRAIEGDSADYGQTLASENTNLELAHGLDAAKMGIIARGLVQEPSFLRLIELTTALGTKVAPATTSEDKALEIPDDDKTGPRSLGQPDGDGRVRVC
jgi:hypothetical protein